VQTKDHKGEEDLKGEMRSSEVKPIPCCIVNDHSDIEPFLLACIRAKRLSTRCVMVHFDAHPDMSVPTPVEQKYDSVLSWKDPHVLYYDVLSSEGCIGEFLLPMMYQRWLSSVIWVRSPWCDQIRDGSHEFLCGNCTVSDEHAPQEMGKGRDQCMVSMAEPYFLDEGVCADSAELKHARAVHLHVCPVEDLGSAFESCMQRAAARGADGADTGVDWVLDICLDYFSTNNPFLAPLTHALHTDGASAADVLARLEVIKQVFRCLSFRHVGPAASADAHVGSIASTSSSNSSSSNSSSSSSSSSTSSSSSSSSSKSSSARARREQRAHCHMVLADVLLGAAASAQQSLSTQSTDKESFLDLFPPAHRKNPGSLFFDTVLPRMSSEARSLLHEMGSLVLLPHQHSSHQDMTKLVQDMRHQVSRLRLRNPHLTPPAAITIARSTGEASTHEHDDGFTMSGIVEALQAQVLEAVQEVLSGWYADEPAAPPSPPRSASAPASIPLTVHKFYETNQERPESDAFTQAYAVFLHPIAAGVVNYVAAPSGQDAGAGGLTQDRHPSKKSRVV